jgi:integrase
MWQRVWIWERRLKRGKAYSLRWRDDQGHVRTESVGPDRRLAERLRSQREVELNSGQLQTTRPVRYEEFVKEELKVMAGRLASSSLDGTRFVLGNFGDVCKPKMLDDVSPAMIESYFALRLEQVSVATANRDLRTLKAALNRAVGRGYVRASPGARLKQVREPEGVVRVLAPDEVGKLLGACPSDLWRAFVALAVTTGMRRGEMLALRWQDVDSDEGVVHVRNTPGHAAKSRRNRVVVLTREVAALLRGLPRDGELVFHNEGEGLVPQSVSRTFGRIQRRAKIEGCTLHDLRRTFVSQLAMAGVNAAVVQKLAGHASITTTVRYYTGVMPEALRAAQAKLPFDGVIRDVTDRYHGECGATGKENRRGSDVLAAPGLMAGSPKGI